MLDEQPIDLLNYLPNVKERVIAFIDEIQYLQDPSNFLKLLYDEHAEKVKIVATGSNAFYMDDHFRDSLAGRKKVFQLLTCSFNEYLQLNGKDELLLELKEYYRRNKPKPLSSNISGRNGNLICCMADIPR